MTAYDVALVDALRPRTRGDCERGPRPCPWVACRHHLAVERYHPRVRGVAALEAAADADLWSMPETCALDVAELGEHTQSEVAEALGISCDRVAEAEWDASQRLRASGTPHERA